MTLICSNFCQIITFVDSKLFHLMNWNRTWIAVTIIGLIDCLILYTFWGFYYEDHSGLATLFQAGIVTGGVPVDDFYIYCQTFTAKIFAFLSGNTDLLPWSDYFYFFFLFFAYVTITFLIIRQYFKTPPKLKSVLLLSNFLFLIFFADSFVFFSWIRLSFIGTFLTLIVCLSIIEKTQSAFLKLSIYGFSIIIFCFCLAIRYETGIAACITAGLYSLCRGTRLSTLISAFALPAAILVFLAIFIFYKANEIQFLKQTEPALYYLSDAVNNPDLFSGKSPEDSIKSVAVLKYFINDEGVITPDFINSLAKEKSLIFSKNIVVVAQNLKMAWQITFPYLTKYAELVIINLLVFILLVKNKRGLAKTGVIVYNIFILIVLSATAYTIKMEARIFVSMLVTSGISNLLLLSESNLILNKVNRIWTIILLILLFSFSIRFITRANTFQEVMEQNKALSIQINKKATGKFLYIDVNSHILLHGALFHPIDLKDIKQYILYDHGQLGFLPFFKKLSDEICQCNSSKANEFFDFLISEKNNLIIISNPERMDFISKYLELVHGQKIFFDRGEKLSTDADLFYFTINRK